MNKEDLRKYKRVTDVTREECYIGSRECSSCMHAFPGNHAVDLMHTDVTPDCPSVCLMCKKTDN
jgi:hypothetical protein